MSTIRCNSTNCLSLHLKDTNKQTDMQGYEEEKVKTPVVATLDALPMGGSAVFPTERYRYVRRAASEYGNILGKRFSVKADWKAGTVTVRRVG